MTKRQSKPEALRLTDATVAGLELPEGKDEHFVWDAALPSFGIRIRAGAKRWYIQYRVGRQQRRESLGDVRKIKLVDAHKIARQRFAQVELGADPAGDRARSRAEAAAIKQTVGSVVELYLTAKKGELRPASLQAASRYLRSHCRALHSIPIATAAHARADVAAVLQTVHSNNGRIAAARCRANLSAMFGWAIRAGMCDVNPVLATNNPGKGARARERVLSDAELRSIWRACPDDLFGRAIKLLVLVGCRRGEVGDLRWDEIDLDSGVMTVLGTRTKNGQALILTLPAMALEILRTTPRQPGQPYVFGKAGAAGFNAWNYHLGPLSARIAAAGEALSPWVIHDLRRSMRSGLGRLGVPPHIAELAIGHHQRGVTAVYDRYSYQAEIKTALARWADHVAAIVDDRQSNVVSIRV